MRPLSTTTTGGALISALAEVTNPDSFTKCYGASFSHTTDANVVIRMNSATGNIFAVLRTVDEKESDHMFFPIRALELKDIYYNITTGGTLILFVE